MTMKIVRPVDVKRFDVSDMLPGDVHSRQIRALFYNGTVEQIEDMVNFLRPLMGVKGHNEQGEPIQAPACAKTVDSLERLLIIRKAEEEQHSELNDTLGSHAKRLQDMLASHLIAREKLINELAHFAAAPPPEPEPAPTLISELPTAEVSGTSPTEPPQQVPPHEEAASTPQEPFNLRLPEVVPPEVGPLEGHNTPTE